MKRKLVFQTDSAGDLLARRIFSGQAGRLPAESGQRPNFRQDRAREGEIQ